MNKPRGETDHCRHRLLKYCQGQGLDLGCGNVKIKPDAIGIDLHSPVADMPRDARKLDYYESEQFDYVYSSHLLEEIQDTVPTLKEWLRVIKPGGNIILYQIVESRYFPIGHPNCNGSHKHHFTRDDLRNALEDLGCEFVHYADNPETKEWSFELVMRKKGEIKKEAEKVETQIDRAVTELTSAQPHPIPDSGISILVPTLKRPQNMKVFVEAVAEMAHAKKKVEILFGIHSDDQDSLDMMAKLKEKDWGVSVQEAVVDKYPDGKPHLSNLWNQLYPKAAYPILGFFGDDVIFRTPGWDIEVQKEFTQSKGIMVSCNDVHIQRGRQATLFFTHKDVHDRFGYYLPPGFRRWYMDTYMDVIFRNAGKLHYREDIVTEHLHPDVFPERVDDTYRALGGHTVPGEGLKEADKALWLSEENRAELRRCIDIVKGIA